MISGRLALGPISVEFGDAERRADELARRVREAAERHAALVAEESELVEKLARIYLPELSPEAVSRGLRELGRQLRTALDDQARRRRALAADLDTARAAATEHEAAVREAEGAEDEASGAVAAARQTVEKILASDPEHEAGVVEHSDIMERRELLKARRARLVSAANLERPGYESYRLFTYLLDRGFGGPEYRAGPVTRRLDAWLARRIGFEDFHRRYRILKVGPHAIQAELRELDRTAKQLEQRLDEIEAGAGERSGLLAALRVHERAQATLVAARAALESATERRDSLASELREVEANRGGPHEAALRLHTDLLAGKEIRELRELAGGTPDPRDDALVSRLDRVREQVERAAADLDAAQRELDLATGTINRLAELARSAATRFSSRRSFFPNDFPWIQLIDGVISGSATPEQSLLRIEQAHVREPILPLGPRDVSGWFAELSSEFDHEIAALTRRAVGEATGEVGSEIIVQDADGTVVHRRISRRRTGDPASSEAE